MYDLPRFYRRAKQSDVDGLVINGANWTVGDFLPVGYEARVRLPNPFWKIVAENTEGALLHKADTGDGHYDTWVKPVSCAEVAAANGLRMTHDSAWSDICGPHDAHLTASPDQAWSWAPRECDLDPLMADGNSASPSSAARSPAGDRRSCSASVCPLSWSRTNAF